MTKQISQVERLQNDLYHLGQELNRLACTTHPVGSAEAQYTRHTFRELEATYQTKVAQLEALGETPAPKLREQVARASAHILRPFVQRPCTGPVPSAVGGARFVTKVWVSLDMVPAFLDALDEVDAVIVSRDTSYMTDEKSSVVHYTISLRAANDLFELGRFMVLCYYASKPEEGGRRG